MFAFLVPTALSTLAVAAPNVSINFDEAALSAAGIDASEFESVLSGQIEDKLQLEADPARMEQLARANAHAVRGLGVDYASNPELFAFGLSVGTAVNSAGFSLFSRESNLLPDNGFTAQAGIMGGLNLGAFSPGTDTLLDRFMVFTNAMGAAPQAGDYKAQVWTWGLHGQYAIVMPVDKGVLTWGGVDVTTGFDLASYSLTLQNGTPIDGGFGTWNAAGTYELKAKATTIPVELSTSASVPGVSMWLGLAADLAPGARATREVALSGDIEDDTNPGTVLGSVDASLKQDLRVKPIGARFFTGFQFDITSVKLYTQLNLSTDRSVGMHAGIRAAL